MSGASRRVVLAMVWGMVACTGGRDGTAQDAEVAPVAPGEWRNYGNDPGGTKYSPLRQIDRSNVARLQVAWTARAGDFDPDMLLQGSHDDEQGIPDDPRAQGPCGNCHKNEVRFETTPLMRDGILLLSTPANRVLGLDPGTGAERWAFDPGLPADLRSSEGLISRGVSAWKDPDTSVSACRLRVYLATIDARLISIDAATGLACGDFGDAGTIDLSKGVEVNGRRVEVGDYLVTSPPAVIGSSIVVGSAIGDNRRRDVESGVVRAYDARTGHIRWAFDPIPRTEDHPASVWWEPASAAVTGAANVWSIISADPERDLVFLPTGSAAPDHYGGDRPGRNDFANSVIAVRGSTGEVVWSFQVVHHDLWDYDVASQPVLLELEREEGTVPAVAVGTKMGHVLVLHRETGEPLFPIEERPVPASTVPGEAAWPTQPFPVLPAPLHETELTPDDAFGVTPADEAFCRAWIEALDYRGIFTPPSLQGTLVWPGLAGGINWGGLAWDPERQLLVTTIKRLPMFVRLHPRAEFRSAERIAGRQYTGQEGTPYGMSRQPLVSPSGLPCSPPPFGKIVGISLRDGHVRWERPLGTVPTLEGVPGADAWGSIVFGGPLVTAGGLTFISASMDDTLRAFDTETGDALWEHELPAGGQAAPMSYEHEGRQYVVIAAGGRGGIGSLGDYIVAFALPE